MLKSLDRLSCWIRGVSYPEPEVYTGIDWLWEPQPWQTRIYYGMRRFFVHIWTFPSRTYADVRDFIQRGRRGWADRDTWSLDWYLSSWLPDALRHLKDTKQGVSGTMFDTADFGEFTREQMDDAQKKQNEVLDKMIAAFEAWTRIGNLDYPELGPCPRDRKPDARKKWYEQIREAEDKDEQIFKEGAALFVKHFGSLYGNKNARK